MSRPVGRDKDPYENRCAWGQAGANMCNDIQSTGALQRLFGGKGHDQVVAIHDTTKTTGTIVDHTIDS